MSAIRMQKYLPAIVVIIGVALPRSAEQRLIAADPDHLVQVETDNADFHLKASELERDAKISRVKIVLKSKRGGFIPSVGSSMAIMAVAHKIAKARKCDYFVNLKEWEDEDKDDSRTYIFGFTNEKDADIKKEFGQRYTYNNDEGQKRIFVSVLQLDALRQPPQPQHK
jgi:hypothetical protein